MYLNLDLIDTREKLAIYSKAGLLSVSSADVNRVYDGTRDVQITGTLVSTGPVTIGSNTTITGPVTGTQASITVTPAAAATLTVTASSPQTAGSSPRIRSSAGTVSLTLAAVAAQGLNAQSRVLSVLPLFHVGGLCIQTLPALAVGAKVLLQPRFEARAGKRPYRLLELPRYRAAYDFLLLRAGSGEVAQELADWWTDFAAADGPTRESMLRPEEAPKKRRRPRRKPTAGAAAAE